MKITPVYEPPHPRETVGYVLELTAEEFNDLQAVAAIPDATLREGLQVLHKMTYDVYGLMRRLTRKVTE